MPGLKVVALVSGGKDSFFSILHCLANGHDVVALANLHPPLNNGEQSEDLDSFMYQTIGHSVISLYEKALGLPLYRQEILGSAVDSNKSYATPSQAEQAEESSPDETESLLPLLRKVMAAHPDVNAVSTGAILSDYQRTRVESIAIRLGLTPLSYLWQYPFLPPYSETSLLDDMIAVGQDSRIIKVASGGLDESFLWENVASMRTKGRLVKAMQRFGTLGDGAAVGEGGEFETLAVDGPWPIWRNSIRVDEDDRQVSLGDAGVASLKIRNARLISKEPSSVTRESVLGQLRKPPMFDEKFESLMSEFEQPENKDHVPSDSISSQIVELTSTWSFGKSGDVVTISNCMAKGATAGEQMNAIMDRLLNEHDIEPSSIAFTTILLRDMADFAGVNTAYGAAFRTPSPPARVTIACGNSLPADVDVVLSVLTLTGAAREKKRGLHVQSRSYWAPANIGPYSQAISVPTEDRSESFGPSFVYVAGQIPLVPTSMDFPPRESLSPEAHFGKQAILSLQHLWRIGQIMDVKLWLGAVAFISRTSDASAEDRVWTTIQTWKQAHTSTNPSKSAHEDDSDEDEEVDLWDRTHGQHQSYGNNTETSTKRADMQDAFVPPCFVAEVETLPRNAPIEWASVGATASTSRLTTTGRLVRPTSYLYKLIDSIRVEHASAACTSQTMHIPTDVEGAITVSWVALYDLSKPNITPSSISLADEHGKARAGTYTIYTTQTISASIVAELNSVVVIPCHRIWDAKGSLVPAVVVFRSH